MADEKPRHSQRRVHDTRLFVGGVADGYGAAVDRALNTVRLAKAGGGYATYQREFLAGDTITFSFWRSEGVSIDEAMKCLFERYKGANRDG